MTALKFSTGYDDCTTCGGGGVVFVENDICTSCPECDLRDKQFEEVLSLDDDRYLSREV